MIMNKWWKRVVVAGTMIGLIIQQGLRLGRRRPEEMTEEASFDKNFGAFPPELPDNMFDDINLV